MSDNFSSSGNESSSEREINKPSKRKHVHDSQIKQAKKKKKKNLLRPLTTEDVNHLRETENLYSSNLIRLQIEEVLSQINLKEKHLTPLDQWWSNFLKEIKNVPEESDVILSNIKKYSNKKLSKSKIFINTLFKSKTDLKSDRECTLKFPKPEDCSVFGEYQLKCSTKGNMDLLVNIKMPSECLSLKDYLNNRYFIKRHYYLLYILHHIKEKTSLGKINLLFYENFKFMPMIRIIPEFSDKVSIYIFVTGSESFFNLNRFLPDKNNVKYAFDDNFQIDVKDHAEMSTPIHNSFLARDFTLHVNYLDIQKSLSTTNIQDGAKLLMLWLKQRELNSGLGSFTNELLFYTISYLVKKKKINSLMSSYQVVRIVWSFIANSKWNEDPISLCDDLKTDRIDMYKQCYDVVFLDITGCFNVASFLDLGVYEKVRQEAQLALKILDGNKFNSFSSLFLAKIPFALQYDALIKLNSSDNFQNIYKNATPAKKWKYYGFYNSLILNEIIEILKQGFTNRLTNIVPYFRERHSDGDKNEKAHILIGINLNSEHAFNVIERGPSEDKPELIKEFQTFWKGKTSFRRFQDSTAAEVVHFPCRTLQDKRNIFLKILDFVLVEKFNLSMQVVSNQSETVLKLEKTILHFPTGTNEEACLKVIHIYTALSKKLRNLELPLMIAHIQGISDVFSYTEVFPPVPTTYKEDEEILQCKENNLTLRSNIEYLPPYVSPIECVIQLGKSSKWPNDVQVLQCMKCEFYIRLSELLEKEHAIISSATLNYLDIFYEGLVFRFKLFVPKELMLLKKTVDNDQEISHKDNEQRLKLEKELDILPKITSTLSGIHLRYPSFGPCCALIKRWLRSQLIDEFLISDTVINLWNASVYINDPPYATPVLPQVAFLRFLKYLTEFDWKLNAVIVNFNDEIDSANLSDMEAKFQQNRNNYPSLHIITPYDQGRSVFTKHQPSKHVVRRILTLAKATYKFLSNSIMNWEIFPIKSIFTPSLKGYDALIHLNPIFNPLSHESVSIDKDVEKNFVEKYDEKISNKMPVTDFNPVKKYLSEIREIYGKYAIFFHDSYGGNVIGILWNKQVAEPKEFNISHVNGKKIEVGKLITHYDEILEDIYNRGSGLLKSIET